MVDPISLNENRLEPNRVLRMVNKNDRNQINNGQTVEPVWQIFKLYPLFRKNYYSLKWCSLKHSIPCVHEYVLYDTFPSWKLNFKADASGTQKVCRHAVESWTQIFKLCHFLHNVKKICSFSVNWLIFGQSHIPLCTHMGYFEFFWKSQISIFKNILNCI